MAEYQGKYKSVYNPGIEFETDYIAREAARDLMYHNQGPLTEYDLNDLPPADVRPVVRGRWLAKEYMYGDPDVGTEDMWIDRLAESTDYYAFCSNCKGDAGFDGEGGLVLSNYCPNCGADMRDKENEN